jgi:hypothetical protein
VRTVRRWGTVFVLWLGAAFVSVGAASQDSTRTIYVRNVSHLTPAEIEDALPAFQAAIDEDFAPIWHTKAKLVYIGNKPAPKGSWRIKLTDYIDCLFCGGYHHNPGGYARGVVSATDGEWQRFFTHELFEILGNPWVYGNGHNARTIRIGTRGYIVETADPVEDVAFAYTRPSALGKKVVISDFVTPAWFDPNSLGKWDFAGSCTGPLQVLKGGYQLYWEGGVLKHINNF